MILNFINLKLGFNYHLEIPIITAPIIPSKTPTDYNMEGISPLKNIWINSGIKDFKLSIAWIGPPFPDFIAIVKLTAPDS